MLRQLRARLTYANVVSTIALVAAVGGGTAYAATKIGTKDIRYHAVTGSKLAVNAVTASKIKNESVSGADMRRSTVTSRNVKDGSLLAADFASGQLPKGDKGDPGVAIFGVVNAAGGVLSQRGVTGVASTDTGAYTITLGQPVSACAVMATLLGGEAGTITAQPTPGNVAQVTVQTRGAAGAETRRAFQFAVAC
jgi:hypothetical protein